MRKIRLELDYLRKILLKIDSIDKFEPITNEELVDGDTPINKVNAYLDLLIEEELIKSDKIEYIDGSKSYSIKYITLKGQAFIDTIKNNNFWQKHKEKIIEAGISSLPKIIMKIIKCVI